MNGNVRFALVFSRQARHEAEADVHALELKVRPEEEPGSVIARVLLVREYLDLGGGKRPLGLGLVAGIGRIARDLLVDTGV
jgi:hypothetical protein